MELRRRLSRHTADVVMALLLSIVVFQSPLVFPAVLLAVKLNVFAVPIALLTSVFAFPLRAWCVIGLLWLSQLIYYNGSDIPSVCT